VIDAERAQQDPRFPGSAGHGSGDLKGFALLEPLSRNDRDTPSAGEPAWRGATDLNESGLFRGNDSLP
jgi:hypothetical protein